MREDQIKRSLQFIQKAELSNVPVEERLKFLQDKLTQEEISEVLKRYEQKSKEKKESEPVQTQGSQEAEKRVNDVNRIFMGVATTASLSILSSLAINYALDNMKDKREKHLREEIKERVFDTLRENTDRLRTLEYSVEKQHAEKVTSEQVDSIINSRLEQLENGRLMGARKNQQLNLKLRSSQASNPNQQDFSREVLEGLKSEMTKELKDIKQVMKGISDQNAELIKELREMNQNFQKLPRVAEDQIRPQNSNKSSSFPAQLNGPVSSQEEKKEGDQPKEEEKDALLDQELSQEQSEYLQKQFQEFIDKFSPNEIKMNLNSLRYVLNQIVQNPTQEKWRKINTSNSMLKAIISKNPDTPLFLEKIGFTKQNEQTYQFQTLKQVENISELSEEQVNEKEMKQSLSGNKNSLAYIVQLMDDKINLNK